MRQSRHLYRITGTVQRPEAKDRFLALFFAAVILVFAVKNSPRPDVTYRSAGGGHCIENCFAGFTVNIFKNDAPALLADPSGRADTLKHVTPYADFGLFISRLIFRQSSSSDSHRLAFSPQKSLLRVLLFPFHFFW